MTSIALEMSADGHPHVRPRRARSGAFRGSHGPFGKGISNRLEQARRRAWDEDPGVKVAPLVDEAGDVVRRVAAAVKRPVRLA